MFVLLYISAVIWKDWELATDGLQPAYLTHTGKSIYNIGKATLVAAARKRA